jgi:ATP-dependent DNA ligase
MNIFQLLGLAPNHRENEKKTTQLVKHYDEVVAKNKEGKDLAVQIKKDGVCSITVIRDGKVSIWSRTAKRFTNTWRLIEDIKKFNLRDGVYFGEMTCGLVSLEVLSGKVNPNRTKALDVSDQVPYNLTMNFFDMISIESFIEGASQTPYRTRYDHLVERVYDGKVPHHYPTNVYVINLIPVTDVKEIKMYLSASVNADEEGIIIADVNAGWVAGHKGWRKMKMVRGVDYDLLCIGYEDGKGKSKGLVANLLFKWKDGKIIKCSLGKGWTHEMARDMYHAAVKSDNLGCSASEAIKQSNPVGKIFQVYALEESSKGKLRLPKVGEQRHDKGESDVN